MKSKKIGFFFMNGFFHPLLLFTEPNSLYMEKQVDFQIHEVFSETGGQGGLGLCMQNVKQLIEEYTRVGAWVGKIDVRAHHQS